MLSAALQRAWPDHGQMGATSDFKSAYNQETALPSQAHLVTVAQYDPLKDATTFFLPLTQIFGGRLAGLNLLRCPNLGVLLIATLFAGVADHCSDDVILLNRKTFAMLIWKAWRRLALLLGWNIPDEKSPLPEETFRAI